MRKAIESDANRHDDKRNVYDILAVVLSIVRVFLLMRPLTRTTQIQQRQPTIVNSATNYLEPGIPAGLATKTMPTRIATEDSLQGFGQLVGPADYQEFAIEIVRWPATGTRPVDPDTGDEAGSTEGVFHSY